MDIKLIETTLAVYNYKSYTEAAYQTSHSPSAVSKHVAQLEDELGVRLFNRQTKMNSISLTPEGEEIIPMLEIFAGQYHSLIREIERVKNDKDQHVRIGYVPLVGTIGQDRIESTFFFANPEVDIDNISRPSKEQERLLKCGLIDAAFVLKVSVYHSDEVFEEMYPSSQFGKIKIYESNTIHMVMSTKNPLAEKKSLSADDLKGQTLIFSHNVEAHKPPVPGLTPADYKSRIMDYRQRSMVLDLVAMDGGILPLACAPVSWPGTVAIPVDAHDRITKGYFIYRKGTHSQALKKLIDVVRTHEIK